MYEIRLYVKYVPCLQSEHVGDVASSLSAITNMFIRYQ